MRNTKELWFKTGTVTRTKDGRRYLPVHDICHIQGPLVCKLLPGQSLTFEGVKFFVVDESENKPAR
jgi:hypothetical protein